MIFIGRYKEFNPNHDYPSIKAFFSDGPYEGQDRIVQYLKSGTEDMVRFAVPKDVFTGEIIPVRNVGMNDGEYTWFAPLAYYVEKYNLRLPEDFEQKILRS